MWDINVIVHCIFHKVHKSDDGRRVVLKKSGSVKILTDDFYKIIISRSCLVQVARFPDIFDNDQYFIYIFILYLIYCK